MTTAYQACSNHTFQIICVDGITFLHFWSCVVYDPELYDEDKDHMDMQAHSVLHVHLNYALSS